MKKIQTRISVILTSVVILSFLLVSCGTKNKRSGGARVTTVVTTTVENEIAPIHNEYAATLVANRQITMHSEVSGRVEDILFKEGGQVKKDQPLYTINKSLYQAAYDQAAAQLNIAETNWATDTTDARRYKNLWSHNAVDKIQLDHAIAQVNVAKASVIAAKANLESARTNLNHATVKAPFSGATDVSKVRLGDVVVGYQTPLVTIVDNSNMNADFFISENDYVQLGSTDKSIKEKLSHFHLVLPDGTMYPYKGELYAVDNRVDPTTGTLTVRLKFPNPGNLLKSGMNCVVRSTQNTSAKVMVIPQKAIQQLLNEYFVYTVNDQGVVSQKKVELGQVSGNMQIIKGGLQPGEKIIVEGIESVRPGEKVKTVPMESGMSNQSSPE
ncbi:MAG: efflux RND transporter periplasmic adaptor subunit [Bacteroidales bacterium]|nr:efflux RND transporter periplasmic adaptor subunit [Bacteroidales bacterium]